MPRKTRKAIIDCYNQQTSEYLGSFEHTNENIINFVAGLTPFQSVRLVERTTDTLILTTIGNFLDQVPDQQWLQKILPVLIAKQTGQLVIGTVEMTA
ncbi:hypothetical protein [Enterococcus faecium]|uniref:Uncharacterized protein n=1 Tax=Enterococcus faecium TaxID=1352 RepID=A0A9X3XUM2_ENTFC|nr:hypothetical protein [Enterococcus faecium]MDC4249087.1 hypothetical protein [Enterococcus faecium]